MSFYGLVMVLTTLIIVFYLSVFAKEAAYSAWIANAYLRCAQVVQDSIAALADV